MARVPKRHKSTIFREINRNFWSDDAFPNKYAGYFGQAAHLQTQKRRSVQRKLIRHPELCKTVVARIKQGWTPEQIGNRMIYEGATLRVCQETIYLYIYSNEVWLKSSGGTCPSIASPVARDVQESAKHPSLTEMSVSCFVPTMLLAAASSATGRLTCPVQTTLWAIKCDLACRTCESVHGTSEEPR